MTVELSCIHWDVRDKDDLSVLPNEFKLETVFPSSCNMSIAAKGLLVSYELFHRVDHLAKSQVYPRSFFWKSSKSEHMHRWSHDMPVNWESYKTLCYAQRLLIHLYSNYQQLRYTNIH